MSLLDEPPSGEHAATASAPARKNWLWPWVAAGVVVVIAGAVFLMWAMSRPRTSTLQAVRFEVALTENMSFNVGANMAVSPDGHWMVFPATRDGVTRYWVRSLDTVEARAFPGTERVPFAPPAAWSYDSR
jgi:hypothetical protein